MSSISYCCQETGIVAHKAIEFRPVSGNAQHLSLSLKTKRPFDNIKFRLSESKRTSSLLYNNHYAYIRDKTKISSQYDTIYNNYSNTYYPNLSEEVI